MAADDENMPTQTGGAINIELPEVDEGSREERMERLRRAVDALAESPYASATAYAASQLRAPSDYDERCIEDRCRLIGQRVADIMDGRMAVEQPTASGGTRTVARARVTSAELAECIGESAGTVGNVRAGKPTAMTVPRLMRIAAALDVPLEYLMYHDGFATLRGGRPDAPCDLATARFRREWELETVFSMLPEDVQDSVLGGFRALLGNARKVRQA